MPSRFDYDKGRYVEYSYRQKGDVFTRGESPRPRIYTVITKNDTGQRYVRRMRTYAVNSLTMSQILEHLKEHGDPKETLDTLVFYMGHWDSQPYASNKPFEGYEAELHFTKTEQHTGVRYWFICPGCGTRRHKVYAAQLEGGEVWGCQKCLGLSYPSQYGHKTVWYDNRVTGKEGHGIRGTNPSKAPKSSSQ